MDPGLFPAWRATAMAAAPRGVQAWLRQDGDVHLARVSGVGPYATGPIESFLRNVTDAPDIGKGRIGNLPRLDIRLGLLAAAFNRELDREDTLRRPDPLP